tara:strand:- start:293 stop:1165 length:873 start_codon:yes stop_codon:yes gene_type:complete
MTTEQITDLITQYGALVKKYKVPKYHCTISPWRYSDPLVQPNLPLIMQLADENNIGVKITTNAVSFTKKMCETLQSRLHILGKIHISVIGHTEQEVWDQMKVKKNKTLERLLFVKNNYPDISKKIQIGIKHKDNIRASDETMQQYREVTLGRVMSKQEWMHNRLGDGDGVWHKPKHFDITPEQYIKGCSMSKGRITREMEIMVNGDVVLCCDDADGKTHYGNVFKDGLQNCWRQLQKEHELIYDKEYSDAKKQLICNTCSRGKFHWDGRLEYDIKQKTYHLLQRVPRCAV